MFKNKTLIKIHLSFGHGVISHNYQTLSSLKAKQHNNMYLELFTYIML